MIGLDTNVLVRYLRFEDEDRIRLAISALRRGADLSDENSKPLRPHAARFRISPGLPFAFLMLAKTPDFPGFCVHHLSTLRC